MSDAYDMRGECNGCLGKPCRCTEIRLQRAADAHALADVRTLDDFYAREQLNEPLAPHLNDSGGWCVLCAGTLVGWGATPDEARHKAAEWVRAQAKGGA